MNLTVFPVSTTNIFPISNSHAGGQLLTEFNLRSRESVGTDPAVTYSIGPSYVHSLDDFDVTLELDGSGVLISTSAIMISPGKAVVNGHYIESLTPITIDIDECNARLISLGQTALKGKLCVGLRVMYSTEQTMNGAMQVENSIGLYTGIQVVILPKEGSGEVFTTPSDSPTDESKVNAHIKLAEFSFSNGTVSSIKRNDDKISMFTADRISSINSFISDIYVKKTGLDPWKIYTYAGNGADTQYDTWCDSMDSLMVWDNDPHTVAGAPNGVQSATFWYNPLTDKVVLQLPHKQPDGGIYGTDGNQRHYEDKILNLPSADYGLCTGGVVTKAYTSAVRDIDNKIQTFYRLPQGKMRYYYDGVLTEKAKEKQFPQIYDNCTWTPGDYILVSQDATVSGTARDIVDTDATVDVTSIYGRYPSTMYVVLPPVVADNGIEYVGYTANPDEVPSGLVAGVRIGYYTYTGSSYSYDNISFVSGLFGLSSGSYRGIRNQDYFVVAWENTSNNLTNTNYYFYKVSGTEAHMDFATNPIFVTGAIPFAQESVVGGFLNVPADSVGGGYVYRDDNGHLRLADYQILATGVLAYQLGQDSKISGTMEEIQNTLDQYINDRVAFPNSTQFKNYAKYNQENNTNENPNIIHLYIDLPELTSEDGQQTIDIYDVDSRFSTPLYIHLTGNGNPYTIVNINNCEKVRIFIESGTPAILLNNSCLYYDPHIIDTITTIQNMTLWYEKFEQGDPDIQVNGMTVELVGSPSSDSGDEDYWNVNTPNDNHYRYALRGVTFGPDGTVTGLSMYVTDDITGNNSDGTYVFASNFALPQGSSLQYPPTKVTKALRVTGTFVTAYPMSQTQALGYVIKDTTFTAYANSYQNSSSNNYVTGTISFLTEIKKVSNVAGDISPKNVIDGWTTGQYHIFYGGAVE